LVAKARTGIESPAGEDGGAATGDFADEGGIGRLGRADDDVAGAGGGVEGNVAREGDAEGLVDTGEFVGLRVEHHGQRGTGEGAKDFLALAEAVAEEHGSFVLLNGGAAPGDDIAEDTFGRRERVVWSSIRRLHDDEVGGRGQAGFGGAAGAELEISGVEEAAVFGMIESDHGRAVDVAGGVEGDGDVRMVGRERGGLVEGQLKFDAIPEPVGHAGAHERGGAGG
jgi:hypothetical protein